MSFPCCSVCKSRSPFLAYENVLESENARKIIRTMCHSTKIVLCLKCLPKADLMPDSILRDEEFHELLLGFDASDLDVFHSLGVMDVIVIPREARINVRFKKLLRKPLPKAVKLQKLFQAFPPVHRVRFRKYASKEEWFQVLSQKCVEITTFYLNERSLDLHDNFDLMVDRTPLHERTSNRSRGMSFPEDSFVMRHPVSQPHTHNVSVSSLGSNATNNPENDLDSDAFSSQSIPRPNELDSESLNISSQSLHPDSMHLLHSAGSVTNIAARSSSVSSSDDGTIIRMPITTARNVRPTVLADSPQPGPSGLQQPRLAVPARRRHPVAENPSPANFRDVSIQGGRLPRVPGG